MKTKLLCFALICASFTACSAPVPSSSLPPSIEANAAVSLAPSEPIVKTEVENVVRFSATGDNLIHDGIYKQAAARVNGDGYDFAPLYVHMQDFYKQFDVNWINQETLITDELPPASYPNFCTPEALGNAAYDLGFRVFAMSNNHTYDKGDVGINATLRYWQGMPEDVVTTGLFADDAIYDIPVQEINGVKIAYLAYTQYTNGIPRPANSSKRVIMTSETDIIKAQIEKAEKLADFVIVGVHWGNEGSHNVTDGQKQLGQAICDWGADAIIGTHPHVIQPIEYLTSQDGRSVPIAYSLGNFVSSQEAADNLIGIICSFDIVKNGSGAYEAQNLAATPIVTHYGLEFREISVYLYNDYTDELAARHGTKERTPDFSMSYIDSVINNSINPDLLKLK